MQTFVNIRSSQRGLQECLEKFTASGWKVLSVTKGSELTRIGFSIKWTVILENDAEDADVDELNQIADSITSESWGSFLSIFVGISIGCGLVCLFIFLPSLLHH